MPGRLFRYLSVALILAPLCGVAAHALDGPKEWPDIAAELNQEFNYDLPAFAEFAVRHLAPQSDAWLLEALNQPQFPSLRLAAFYSLSERHSRFKNRLRLQLVMRGEFSSLYSKERERIVDAEDLQSHLTQELEAGIDYRYLPNAILTLRCVGLETLRSLTVDERRALPASSLAIVLETMLRSNDPEFDSNAKAIVQERLAELKYVPGYPQLIVVSYTEFQNDDEALKHINYLLEDKLLPEPQVLIALSKRMKLISKSRDSLEAGLGERGKERLTKLFERFAVDGRGKGSGLILPRSCATADLSNIATGETVEGQQPLLSIVSWKWTSSAFQTVLVARVFH